MVMTTLLTQPMSENERRELTQHQQRLNKAQAVALGIWLEAYKAGDVGFEKMIKSTHHCLERIGVSEGTKVRILGTLVNDALSYPVPKKSRGGTVKHPLALRKNAATLVDLVSTRERLPKTRYAVTKSAYEKVSELLWGSGFDVSPSTIIKWVSESKSS